MDLKGSLNIEKDVKKRLSGSLSLFSLAQVSMEFRTVSSGPHNIPGKKRFHKVPQKSTGITKFHTLPKGSIRFLRVPERAREVL